jgi:hypothetical protein
MIEAGAAIVRLSVDNKDFRAQLHTSSRLLNRYGAMVAKIGAAATGAGTALVGSFAVLSKQVANLETQFRRFDLIFKGMGDSIRAELKAISGETGVPMSALVKEASTFGAVFAEMQDDLSDAQFTKVIGNTMKAMLNLAAIGGISLEEAAERLKSGFTSTGESVDQFGFNLRKTALSAEAARLGISKSVLTMSEQEKQLLKLNIFMRQSNRTGISFVSMVDTINGQLTLMQANLTELVYKAGWAIKVAVMPLVKGFNYLLIALRPVALILSPFIVLMGTLGGILLGVGVSLLSVGLGMKATGMVIAMWASTIADLSKLWAVFALNYSYALRAIGATTLIEAASIAWTALAAKIALATTALRAFLLTTLIPLVIANPWLAAGLAVGGTALVAGVASLPTKSKQNPRDYIGHPDNIGDPWSFTRRRIREANEADAAAASDNAASFVSAGAFGSNIAQRLAYGPSVGGTAETNSILKSMAEKMGMVTDGDQVKVSMETT